MIFLIRINKIVNTLDIFDVTVKVTDEIVENK